MSSLIDGYLLPFTAPEGYTPDAKSEENFYERSYTKFIPADKLDEAPESFWKNSDLKFKGDVFNAKAFFNGKKYIVKNHDENNPMPLANDYAFKGESVEIVNIRNWLVITVSNETVRTDIAVKTLKSNVFSPKSGVTTAGKWLKSFEDLNKKAAAILKKFS